MQTIENGLDFQCDSLPSTYEQNEMYSPQSKQSLSALMISYTRKPTAPKSLHSDYELGYSEVLKSMMNSTAVENESRNADSPLLTEDVSHLDIEDENKELVQDENLKCSSEETNELHAQQQRALYNGKQTPLIPFILNTNIQLFYDLTPEQHDLLSTVVDLVKIIDDEHSFFEQFKI